MDRVYAVRPYEDEIPGGLGHDYDSRARKNAEARKTRMQCRGVWPYALPDRAIARLAQRAWRSRRRSSLREFRAGMVQAHRGGEARRHSYGGFRRCAIAPVPPR